MKSGLFRLSSPLPVSELKALREWAVSAKWPTFSDRFLRRSNSAEKLEISGVVQVSLGVVRVVLGVVRVVRRVVRVVLGAVRVVLGVVWVLLVVVRAVSPKWPTFADRFLLRSNPADKLEISGGTSQWISGHEKWAVSPK